MLKSIKLPKLSESVFFAGIVLGLGAAAVQAYFNLLPPMAYGVCMVCHPKELINWLSDHLLNTHWGYSMASFEAPILTVVGVILGAIIAAFRHHEFAPRPARQPIAYFVFGFLMALSAYNAILFVGLRKRSYLYYALYLTSLIALITCYTGHGSAWLWPDLPQIQRYVILVMMVVYGCSGLLFASRFLALKEHAPRTLQWVQLYAALGLAFIVLSILLGSQLLQ